MQFGSQNIFCFGKPEISSLQFCAKKGEMKVKGQNEVPGVRGASKTPRSSHGREEKRGICC